MLASLQFFLAPFGCSLAYLPGCMLDILINYLNVGCEEFEIFTYTVFQKLDCFSVFVSILDIGTVFPYYVIQQFISVVLIA